FAEEIRRRIKLLYPQAKDVPDPAAEWARDFPGVSCTIGVSSHPMMNEALRQTDEAMIFGKQHGRNRVVFWEEAYRPPD
ncbi:MAG: hypothetical protein QNK37_32485, partial [Acidobacteriota bacterium]|nr:hypothetical protein [Acidobacteriota bacterium]